jgi:hypothetical protein
MDTTTTDALSERIDRKALDTITVNESGQIALTNFGHILEMAKLLSMLGVAVPKHLRGNRELCLAIVMQAQQWHMDPRAVAAQSYVVQDNIAYQSQLIHAVIESRAPLKARLQPRYDGDGDERVCIVSGTFNGEDTPREWRSPPIGKRRPKSGGSPLWQTKPDVQLFYDTARDWCRIYCPDVLLGIYTRDEMEEFGTRADFPRTDNPLADAPSAATIEASPVAALPQPEPEPQKRRGWPPGKPRKPRTQSAAPETVVGHAQPVSGNGSAAQAEPQESSIAIGAMVVLNNPNPPLSFKHGGHDYVVGKGEPGQVVGTGEQEGTVIVVWRSYPGVQVVMPLEWLATEMAHAAPVAPTETATPVAEPAAQAATVETASDDEYYDGMVDPETGEVFDDDTISATKDAIEAATETFTGNTATEYTEYATRWLAISASAGAPKQAVIDRWEAEKVTRSSLAVPFTAPLWTGLRQTLDKTIAQLQ